MKFLIRKSGNNQKAHIWEDGDTLCRMASTGGIKVSRFNLFDDDCGKDVCTMCNNSYNARSSYAEFMKEFSGPVTLSAEMIEAKNLLDADRRDREFKHHAPAKLAAIMEILGVNREKLSG